MPVTPTPSIFGRHVYALGLISMALIGLVLGDFLPGQPVPKDFPVRNVLAYTADAFMLIAAAAIAVRRTAAWGAAALTAYYTLVVILLMNGRLLLTNFAVYGTYEDLAEQLSIVAGGLILFAASANIGPVVAARLACIGRFIFGLCALIFGGAHFVYMNLTAPLVPKWLPPSQVFWGYVTGIAFVAAGIALITGIQARLAAVLLTVMLASFALLIHEPMLFGQPSSHFNWTESAINFAIIGVAWVVADSLPSWRLYTRCVKS